jgi:hypothetical protein
MQVGSGTYLPDILHHPQIVSWACLQWHEHLCCGLLVYRSLIAHLLACLIYCRPMRADSEGNVYWSRNGAVEVACNFEGLSAYPYGPVK